MPGFPPYVRIYSLHICVCLCFLCLCIYVGMCILMYYEYVLVTLLPIPPSAIGLFSYTDWCEWCCREHLSSVSCLQLHIQKLGCQNCDSSALYFWGTSVLSSTVAVPVYIPTNSAQGFLFSTSSPTLVTSCVFDKSHSDRCEVIFHGGFHLCFPDDEWQWSVGHFNVFFWEMSILPIF